MALLIGILPTCTGRFANVALVALLVTACSPKTDAETADSPLAADSTLPRQTATSENRDACSLIAKQEADSILGSPVTPTPRPASGERSVCDYVPAGGPGAQRFESFTLEVRWTRGQEEIKIARSSAKQSVGVSGGKQDEVVSEVMGLQRVDGLGDEAYFSRRAMSYVRKGDALLVFQVAGLDEPARKRWETLARIAVSRL